MAFRLFAVSLRCMSYQPTKPSGFEPWKGVLMTEGLSLNVEQQILRQAWSKISCKRSASCLMFLRERGYLHHRAACRA